MKVVFMGSDILACPALKRLIDHSEYEVAAVISQPDRPKGRNPKPSPCPAKAAAEQAGLPVLTPEKISSRDSVNRISRLDPDIIVVAAYGQYISSEILEIPVNGAINIHPSLLPKYRGAAPIQWAVAQGETETGVTILYVSSEMDAGDIIRQEKLAIEDDDTAETLAGRLAGLGADLLMDVLEDIRFNRVSRTPQNHEQATMTRKLKKEDGRIDWNLPAEILRNRIRGFAPWPGCFCKMPDDSILKIWKAGVEKYEGDALPGTVLSSRGKGPLIATSVDALRLLEVQPQGKKRMNANAFLCGRKLQPGLNLR